MYDENNPPPDGWNYDGDYDPENWSEMPALMDAWNVCVAAFRAGRPERFKDLDAYLDDEPTNVDASETERVAFCLLDKHGLKYPYLTSIGE
jgi:hypothetical protein